MPAPPPLQLTIVGAGFSGTLTAVHLLRQSDRAVHLHLVERDPAQFCRGVAYGSAGRCHLLNVPAARMSALPDQPDHFLQWAGARAERLVDARWVPEVGPDAFLPRRAYGDYLAELLDQAEEAGSRMHRLHRHHDKAVGLDQDARGLVLHLASGTSLRTDRLVLALGNFPPGHPAPSGAGFLSSPRYHRNPWRAGALEAVLRAPSCLLAGSGLTMVDWVLALDDAGYEGTIHTLSRRGLWPQGHAQTRATRFRLVEEPPSVRRWLRQMREAVAAEGGQWHAVVDSLRPATAALWARLPASERQRFLRHLRPFWEVHRHRVAPRVAHRLHSLLEAGRIVHHAGRILDGVDTGGAITLQVRRRGASVTTDLRVGAVVNCSGADGNYRRLESTLVDTLLRGGLMVPDRLGLGLRITPEGALLDGQGRPSARLFTLGPACKGLVWESTAVPELRGQAAKLAGHLLATA